MDKLNDIFNIAGSVVPSPKPETPVVVQAEGISDVESDYELARNTLRNIISSGTSALDDVILLARSSEHPRSYEVAGQMMKTMSEVAKDLLGLQKQKQDISKPIEAAQAIEQQNNIIFAGSTDDLLKMMGKKDSTIDHTDIQ
jgi:hypothetical protein